jgi:rare lipoprotein A
MLAFLALAIASCGTRPVREGSSSQTSRTQSAKAPSTSRPGFYQNDGPGTNPPPDLDSVPDAVPRLEPLHRFANRPYTVLGRDYTPLTALAEYRERGLASWYGRQFHGQKTAIGEIYDMYGMTAAHPTLPIPCYARVTNVATGKSVIVRVNDRGPFWSGRIIDLSYAAAHRLGIAQRGSGEVRVETILPDTMLASAKQALPPPAVPAALSTAHEESPLREDPNGVYLQLGAFANYANAENFLDHVQSQVVWLGETASVSQREGLYRVQMGPYPDREEARRVSDLVK